MKVAFVYAPIVHQVFAENLQVVDQDFGRLPPISLAYAAAVAEKAGHEVCIVDANALGLGQEQVLARLREFGPDALAFTLSTYQFHQTTSWMRFLRDALGVPTIAGGVNLRLFPEETVAHPGVDHGVLHYGTVGLPLLLDALQNGRNPAGLDEVVTRAPDGTIVMGPVDSSRNPWPSLPPPARHLLPNEQYYSIVSQRRNFTVMMTGTGCGAKCSFCAISGTGVFRNPVSAALDEVETCVRVHGIREIDFFDADFFGNRAYALEFCTRLAERNLDLEWSCRASLWNLDRELLRVARRSGCRQMDVGIETASDDVLRSLRKPLTQDQVRSRLVWMKEEGIRALGFFVIGVPGETTASALRTIRYAMELPIDFAQFSRLIVKPGSSLHFQQIRETGRDYWREWVLGRWSGRRIPGPAGAMDDETVTVLTRLAYLAFYFRPNYVLRTLARMRSADELVRSGRTALRMLGNFARPDLKH